jgi:hypothetical protein
MDIFFQDPSEIPLSPDEVRIRHLRAEPWPDGRRVGVYLEVDPFQRRPNADLVVTAPNGEEVAQVSIIEPMTRKMELTLHLRAAQPGLAYTLRAVLFYSEPLPDPKEHPGEQLPAELPARTVVDSAETTFEIQTPMGE